MKQFIICLNLFSLLLLGGSSCQKDDNSVNPATTNLMPSGKWQITLFNDSGKDETAHFTGYAFSFNADGTITAAKGASITTGTYRSEVDNSQSKLILNFGTTDTFEELNEDWHILEETFTKFRLEHISGGNGGTDLLTFEKRQ